MELTVVKNKANGQVSIIIPKGIAELYKIDNTTKVILEPKNKNEFVMKIE